MATRKKTPDILADLLGGKPKTGEAGKPTPPRMSVPRPEIKGSSAPSLGDKEPRRSRSVGADASPRKPSPSADEASNGTQAEREIITAEPVPQPPTQRQIDAPREPGEDHPGSTLPGEAPTDEWAPGEDQARSPDNGLSRFVTFTIEGRRYALPLARVERALRMVALVPVPDAPPWIAGVLNLHGRSVSVLDLRRCFGLAPRPPILKDRLLITHVGGQPLAMMVDDVNEVLEIPAQRVESLPLTLSETKPVCAAIHQAEELILVLASEALIPSSSVADDANLGSEDVRGTVPS